MEFYAASRAYLLVAKQKNSPPSKKKKFQQKIANVLNIYFQLLIHSLLSFGYSVDALSCKLFKQTKNSKLLHSQCYELNIMGKNRQ